ncbi:MAG: hypothetical protein J0M04_25275 [Verrucomicrobia bacterium]|nr:hypothetical protein [Verrucomicrobiota bacterium]
MNKLVFLAFIILAVIAGVWGINRRALDSPSNGGSGSPRSAGRAESGSVGAVPDAPAVSKRGTERGPDHEDRAQMARAVETQEKIVAEKQKALAECVRRNGVIYQADTIRDNQPPRTLTDEEIKKTASLRSEYEARKIEFETAQRDLAAMRKRLEDTK